MVCDLFVRFRERTAPDGEQVHFALSRNGFHRDALNGGRPVLWAYYGDRGVRDKASMETRHMIIVRIIERVEVRANRKIHIKFRISLEQFLGESA